MTQKTTAFSMHPLARAALAVLAGMAAPGLALAQLAFSQQPPTATTTAGSLPNIIVAVDQTG